ncbi:hypothetical protein [Rhizobium sp. L245/93]|uniref:hypothetical protein n=1 Tax=Rhizobium sp. L245/93 TaxID=2819998 RepID=UPI001ADBF70C|nr:hypothetical protein [Rhizobium sp. L245/93]MBO9172462.1 hypothetical protein [Rhizobium sp. L245/93]
MSIGEMFELTAACPEGCGQNLCRNVNPDDFDMTKEPLSKREKTITLSCKKCDGEVVVAIYSRNGTFNARSIDPKGHDIQASPLDYVEYEETQQDWEFLVGRYEEERSRRPQPIFAQSMAEAQQTINDTRGSGF